MQDKKTYKLAIIAPVPFYYHTPFYQELAKSPEIDLTVYYCSNETLHGTDIEKAYNTKGSFGAEEDLLKGYSNKFLKNYSPEPSFMNWPFGLINFGIWKEIKQGKYDAVVLQSWTNLTWWLAFLACLRYKTPVLFMTDSNVVSESTKSAVKIYIKKILLGNFLFKKASGFLTSGGANEQFYGYYGVPAGKMVRVPFSWGYRDLLKEAEKIKNRREETRRSFGISQNDFVILYVGRLSKEKLPLTILDAYNSIDKPNKKLFLVGDGPMRLEVEQKIKDLKIKNVYLAGFLPRKSTFDFYNMADVFVLPSKAETWGIVVNEAMCFSLPVLVSDRVGAGVDLVKNGYNGFIFKTGDAVSLSEDIKKIILLSPEERLLYGIRSKEIITEWTEKLDGVKQMLKMLEVIQNKK